MTSETDEQFLDSMEQWVIGSLVFKREHRERLFTLARRGAAVRMVAQRTEQINGGPPYVETTYIMRDPLPLPPSGETSDE